jgi:hypothetical protein
MPFFPLKIFILIFFTMIRQVNFRPFCTVIIMILSYLCYRLVTVFSTLLRTVSVFGPTLPSVTERYKRDIKILENFFIQNALFRNVRLLTVADDRSLLLLYCLLNFVYKIKKLRKLDSLSCSNSASHGCCCTDGGCRQVEGNCQSDNWYVSPANNKTILCAPYGCDNPCTINATANPKTYVIK